ncbi:hypothetical protein ACJIZ3_001366 [Penstemon smallii]|uniref:Kinesin-like protein n=1 Tax=Penstemon smallii TaxID=265156 RepID=A0ABD3U6Z4_9LAMI
MDGLFEGGDFVDTVGASNTQQECSSQGNSLQLVQKIEDISNKVQAVLVQTLPVVTSVLDGYNVCIFAYGQTGTGKTYTMEGTPENRGVNYRTLEELFRLSNERSSIMRYELFVSMLEVYNEKIRDLLVENSDEPAKKLEIKQSAEGTQEVPGLVEARVHGTDEVWGLLTLGGQARSVGSTHANELSSRSHCLLRVTVVGENLINGNKTKSHLWLVDLAGSERVGKILAEGDRLKESQFINKSLSALGDVISALASKTSHVPYRNSKLTHMLQSSLGGDCKTLMFVQISPNVVDLGETLCSLNFASRVRGVEHGPARRQTDPTELFKYKQLAEKTRQDEKETKKLQDSLHSLQFKFTARENLCRNLQEKVRDLENQLAEERKTRLKQENRALATISAHSSSAISTYNQAQKSSTDRKPPLIPTKCRLPLRKITNLTPTPSPTLPQKNGMSVLPAVHEYKETFQKENPVMRPRRGSIVPRPQSPTLSQKNGMSIFPAVHENKENRVMRPRRGSLVVRPPQGTNQIFQPKRRASVAIFRSESNNITSLQSSTVGLRNERGWTMNFWERQKASRQLSLSSPLPQLSKLSTASTVETTPIGSRSSKFRGSPPSNVAGSWRPKHPTVVALQKKHFVWSPLKSRVMKNSRKSII